MAAGSTGVVLAAMVANAGIAVLKFGGFLLTGSPSMLAETYHSISDTGNQVLLLVGIFYSRREADRAHPFGYGKAQFFYAFLVSVLLFGVAGWESLKHGVHEFRHGGDPIEAGTAEFLWFTIDVDLPVDAYWIAVAVLLGAVVFETYAFMKARAEVRRQMRVYGWRGYREAFARMSDLPTLTAFIEDAVALLGLLVALVGISAARVTGDHRFDAVGAVLIGVLLMVFAVALAVENKRLILGESLPASVEDDLRAAVEADEAVVELIDLRSMFIGADRVLVTAEVLVGAGLGADDVDDAVQRIEETLREADRRVTFVSVEADT